MSVRKNESPRGVEPAEAQRRNFARADDSHLPTPTQAPETESASLTKPPSGGHLRQWEALGLSRATWYRRGKPTTKPEPKLTQKDVSEILGCSMRTVQRDLAGEREKQRQKNVARVREYMAQGYSQDEACELTAAELRAGAIEKLISEGRLVGFAQASQEVATLSQSRDNGAEAAP
jgi:uncharacterized protein YoaH (UPF0181 family)